MTPTGTYVLKLAALTGVLWGLYLCLPDVPIPGLLPATPTLLAVTFATGAHRMRVGSWPVVIAFSLSFFVEGGVEFFLHDDPNLNLPGYSHGTARALLAVVEAGVFSPVSLWGPLLFTMLVYGVLRGRDTHRSRGSANGRRWRS